MIAVAGLYVIGVLVAWFAAIRRLRPDESYARPTIAALYVLCAVTSVIWPVMLAESLVHRFVAPQHSELE